LKKNEIMGNVFFETGIRIYNKVLNQNNNNLNSTFFNRTNINDNLIINILFCVLNNIVKKFVVL